MLKRLTLLFTISFSSLLLSSQNLEEILDSVEIQDIVITHSKIPIKARLTAKPIQIVSDKMLRLSSGKDLSQVLNEVAGIDVIGALSNGGKDKSVFVRGASGEYTIILVDGTPILDPSGIGGVADLRLFSLSDILKIEILKGSQSVLYGSDAIAGVINIITNKSEKESFKINGKLSYGSYQSWNSNVGISGQAGKLGYKFGVGTKRSNGISEALSADPDIEFNKDGHTLNSANARFDLAITNALSLKPFLRYSDYESDTDDGSFVDADNLYMNKLLIAGSSLVYEKSRFSGQINYSYTSTDRVFDSSFGQSNFFGRFHNIDVWGNYNPHDKVEVIAGLNYQSHGMIDESTTIIDPSENIISPYISFLLYPAQNLNAEVGFRYNNHSKFGANTNLSAAFSYWFSDKVKVFSNYSTGFKAPNLFQLYGAFGANEQLLPQRSKSFEIGLQSPIISDLVNPQITFFSRQVNDVIVYSFVPGYFNRDEQNDEGVELEFGLNLHEDLLIKLQYTYLNGETKTRDDNGQEITIDNLYRRPKHNVGISIFYSGIEKLSLSARLSRIGERNDLFFNPANFFISEEVFLDKYIHLNAHVKFDYSEKLTAFLDMKNLTNTKFQEVYGFSTLGFNIRGGILFEF